MIIKFLGCAVVVCALIFGKVGAAENKTAAKTSSEKPQGLSATVYLLAVGKEIMAGKLLPMDDGFYVLKMEDRIVKVSPQFLVGVFSSRAKAEEALALLQDVPAGGRGEGGMPASMDGAQARQLLSLMKQAREKVRELRQSQTPRREIEMLVNRLKTDLNDPQTLLKNDVVVRLYAVAILPVSQRNQQQFFDELEAAKAKVGSLKIAEDKRIQIKQVLKHAQRINQKQWRLGE